MEPLMIQLHKLQFKNSDSPENLIRYITRTRPNEDRAAELVLWGTSSGYTRPASVEDIIYEFKWIQHSYHAKGSLMCHYCILVRDEVFQRMDNDIFTLGNYAVDCCNYLFNMGHQACFAIHRSHRDGLHIHLAINTINFQTGYKLRQYHTEIRRNVEIPLRDLFQKYLYRSIPFSDYMQSF